MSTSPRGPFFAYRRSTSSPTATGSSARSLRLPGVSHRYAQQRDGAVFGRLVHPCVLANLLQRKRVVVGQNHRGLNSLYLARSIEQGAEKVVVLQCARMNVGDVQAGRVSPTEDQVLLGSDDDLSGGPGRVVEPVADVLPVPGQPTHVYGPPRSRPG